MNNEFLRTIKDLIEDIPYLLKSNNKESAKITLDQIDKLWTEYYRLNSKKCDDCKNFKTIDVWEEKFEDKHGVLCGDVGRVVKFYKQQCQDCGNIILTEKILTI